MDIQVFLAPVNCSRLYLSLEHPDRFLKEIGKAPREAAEEKQAA